jgi:RHS repeat-associated protein
MGATVATAPLSLCLLYCSRNFIKAILHSAPAFFIVRARKPFSGERAAADRGTRGGVASRRTRRILCKIQNPNASDGRETQMKTPNARQPGLLTRILCWFFAVWMAMPASVTAQVTLMPPIFPSSNTVRLSIASGATTNVRYDVYFTNALATNTASWALLATGAANQVIFDLPLPDTNQGFFMLSATAIVTTNPPPKVATPVFTPPSASGNASVNVTVTCETPGAVIYYTTNGMTPTTSDIYIANGGKVLIQCVTTLKARAFRTDFVDSDVATGTYNVNCPPTVSAGSQQTTSGSSITLAGSASDDGLTQPLSNYWRQISGPANVTFGNPNSLSSSVTLPIDGIFVLQLEAFDGYWTSTSRVTVARNPQISIAVTRPAASSTFNVPTNIALEASTNGSSVAITQVQFYAGSQLIGKATNSGGINSLWTFEWRNAPAGNHSIIAVATSSSTSHLALASSPVNITVNFPTDIGRFTFSANDLTIPGAGIPITITRMHDPRFGSGNAVGYNARLDHENISISKSTTLGVGYTALNSGGQHCISPGNNRAIITVSLSPTEQYYFRPLVRFQGSTDGVDCVGASSVTYQTPIRYTFQAVGPLGGKLDSFNAPSGVGMMNENAVFGDWSGTIEPAEEEFFDITPYEPSWTLFTFTAPDGTKYKFDSNGKVSQRIDRNNNTLTYTSSSITHSSGKQVQFTTSSGRITEVKDPISIASSGPAAIKYSYDSSGRMTNVARLVDRSGAGTYENTAYRYEDGSNPNLITRVIDPRGITTISNSYDSFGRLTRQHDAFGNYTSFAYEDNGRRQIVTDKNGKSTRQELTEAGQVESIQNAEGAVTSFQYDANGRQIAEVTPIGATNSFAYNDRDEVIGTTNEIGVAAGATYNSFGFPLIVVDGMGFGMTNGYDSKGNLLATTNAIGIVTRYGYDNQGNRTAQTNAFGLSEQTVTLFQYNSFGYLTNITDPLGSKIGYTYDDNGNRLTERRERTLASGTKQTLLVSNMYDAANRVIGIVDADGFTNRTVLNSIGKVAFTTNKQGVVTRFDYDARGLLTNTVFALGSSVEATERAAYDAEGRRTNSWDRAGRPTSYTFDGIGRPKRTMFVDGAYTENQYDAAGRVFATVQGPRPPGGPAVPPPGLTTRYEYDAAGRRTAVINALNQTNRFRYDANGNQTNFVDALSRTNVSVFDRLNRLVQTIYPDQTSERFAYDGLSRRVFATNQALIVTRIAYDGIGRIVAVTNATGTGTSNWATYAYDEVGNQTNQVDALNRKTLFEYDAVGHRTRTLLPGNQAELFAYDAVGNLIRHTNFNAVILTNQYDPLNRLTNRASGGGYQITFTYSATDKRATMTDPSGTTTYSYDTRDRLTTNSSSQGRLVYSYDLFGNLQNIASARSGGANTTYGYDFLNRVTSVSGNSASVTYGFDGVGNLETVRLGNTVTNTYNYSSLNRLTNLIAKSSSGTLASFAYQVAAAGNRTNLSENIGGTTRTHVWSYDPLYRLTNEVISGTAPTGSNRYRYDAVGNRTNRTTTFTGITLLTNQSFTFNSNDWLSTDVYDNNGNTRTNAGAPYFYDAENRLTNFNNGAANYVYNGDGWLVRKTVGSTTTLYLVDDRNPSGYAQTIEEATVSGGMTNVAVVYLLGLDLAAQNRGGTVSYYGYDGNGNVRYLTSTGATITDTYLYDAFGVELSVTGSTVNEFRYLGERQIPETGLFYLRARYMSTGTGRFWTRDTFEGRKTDPLSLHRYLYAHDNPVNMMDPTGQESISSIITSLGSRMRVAASYVSSVASRAAPYLKRYFTSTKMAQRAAIGALIGGTIDNYVEFYIAPTVDELILLSNEMTPLPALPDGRNPSAEVMKLAVLGAQLNEELAAGQVSAPLRAQLPPYNWVNTALMGKEAISYIAHVEESVASLGASFGLNVNLEISTIQVAWFALLRQLDPDGDVRVAREAAAAYNQGDSATLARKIAELQKRLEKYGTVTIVPAPTQ